MDIWYCLVTSTQLSSNGYWGYRLVRAIKTTLEDVYRGIHQEDVSQAQYHYPNVQTMIFTRAPDETIFVQADKEVV